MPLVLRTSARRSPSAVGVAVIAEAVVERTADALADGAARMDAAAALAGELVAGRQRAIRKTHPPLGDRRSRARPWITILVAERKQDSYDSGWRVPPRPRAGQPAPQASRGGRTSARCPRDTRTECRRSGWC